MQLPAVSASTKTRSRVLVVEDDKASRAALSALLRLVGFDPLSASSVAEGLMLLDKSPECLILDLMLPDGNGGSLLAHIRRNNLPISVAVTTGAVDWKAMVDSAAHVPDAVFTKPLDFRQLTDWLRSRCGEPVQT